MPTKDDWRRQGQEGYLKNLTFTWELYSQNKSDHDHCEFCNAKFMKNEDENILTEGYTSKDRYRWICENCFKDFRKEFNWNIEHMRS
ncbi:MAG: hypothetical protein DRQ78_10330 [Epsilonproteobacteria bacterium]|nr:MAG: hypothetical protein DRQ78_10330 [Campylobacterota bacterium]